VNTFIRHIAAGYLACIILLRMMAMPISLIDYSLNRSFILSNLCENRLKPEIHCAGTCYLKKQLAKTNDNQPSSNQKGSSPNLLSDFCQSPDKPDFGCVAVVTVCSFHSQAELLPIRFAGSVFRPPMA
jgi:hypothetical protein